MATDYKTVNRCKCLIYAKNDLSDGGCMGHEDEGKGVDIPPQHFSRIHLL